MNTTTITPIARMYRVKADGSRYSKPTKTYRNVTAEDLWSIAEDADWPVEFADADGDTIVVTAPDTDTPDENTAPEPETDFQEPVEEDAPQPKPTDPEALEKRIAALMAKADSTEHPEEAHAFYAKAEKLMLKHAVERARVEAILNGDAPEDVVTTLRVAYTHVGERFKALGVIGSSLLVDAVGLTGLAIDNYGKTIILYGRTADCEHMRRILEAAWRQAEHHLRAWRKTDEHYLEARAWGKQSGDWSSYYGALEGYVVGFCEGAAARIREARQETVSEDSSTELVLVGLKKEIDEELGKLPRSRMKAPRVDGHARSQGYISGTKATLAEEVSA